MEINLIVQQAEGRCQSPADAAKPGDDICHGRCLMIGTGGAGEIPPCLLRVGFLETRLRRPDLSGRSGQLD